MARFILLAALSVTTLAIAVQLALSTPALAQHRPHHHGAPALGAPSGALTAAPGRRPVVMPAPRPRPPREPSVGRPLPGTFAGGFDPFYGRAGEIVVLRPAVQRVELDVTINAVPAIAGIRAAPVGEPLFIRVGADGMHRHAGHHGRHMVHHHGRRHGRH